MCSNDGLRLIFVLFRARLNLLPETVVRGWVDWAVKPQLNQQVYGENVEKLFFQHVLHTNG